MKIILTHKSSKEKEVVYNVRWYTEEDGKLVIKTRTIEEKEYTTLTYSLSEFYYKGVKSNSDRNYELGEIFLQKVEETYRDSISFSSTDAEHGARLNRRIYNDPRYQSLPAYYKGMVYGYNRAKWYDMYNNHMYFAYKSPDGRIIKPSELKGEEVRLASDWYKATLWKKTDKAYSAWSK